jgi:hypothetical protein
MLRRRAAVLGIGRVGGDRLNAQELEQPREAVVEVGIDMSENGVELLRRGHVIS